jgi:hypothetical protein
MKISLEVKYTNGESANYIAGLPEWARWERKTGKSTYSATPEKIKEVGFDGIFQQNDFLLLAYYCYLRAAAGKPTKSYEIWELTVDELNFGDTPDPKATQPEA